MTLPEIEIELSEIRDVNTYLTMIIDVQEDTLQKLLTLAKIQGNVIRKLVQRADDSDSGEEWKRGY